MQRPALLSLPLALALLAACSSTASDKGAATGQTVDEAARQVETCSGHLDATLLALKDLVEKPGADLVPQFKTYKSHLSSLESSASSIAALAAKLDARSAEYFAR